MFKVFQIKKTQWNATYCFVKNSYFWEIDIYKYTLIEK